MVNFNKWTTTIPEVVKKYLTHERVSQLTYVMQLKQL